MGLLDKLKGEFIDIVEWNQGDEGGILAFRFPRYNNEIKMGAKLTVREGQAAVFVNEGQIADVYEPGMYELTTKNMPILSTLKGWKHGFESPFKAEVYFIDMTQQTDHKWGTANPIMKRDADFGMVRLRAHGSYVFRVVDPASFIRELVSTDPTFEDYEIDSQLRQVIVAKFADVIGKSNIPVLDLVGNYEELAKFVLTNIVPDFEGWGLEVNKFYIQSVTLPPAVEEAMDKRTSMGVIGNLSQYAQYQSAEAIRDAAQNTGGGAAAAGVGLGVGMSMAQLMAHQTQQATSGAAVPPPVPQQQQFHIAVNGQNQGPFDMATLANMIKSGQMTRESLVWCQGMANWTAASQVEALSGLFASQPPPIPK